MYNLIVVNQHMKKRVDFVLTVFLSKDSYTFIFGNWSASYSTPMTTIFLQMSKQQRRDGHMVFFFAGFCNRKKPRQKENS